MPPPAEASVGAARATTASTVACTVRHTRRRLTRFIPSPFLGSPATPPSVAFGRFTTFLAPSEVMRRLSAPDNEVDGEAAAPECSCPGRLADHAPSQRTPRPRLANPADRAVPRPDPLLRNPEPQAEHAWYATANWRR